MSPVEVVITGPADWISQYAAQLVQDRVIACAQIADISSTYRWAGDVENAIEARAALHTVEANVPAIIKRTNAEHPYDVPCILVLPIQGGDPAYLDWVAASSSLATP